MYYSLINFKKLKNYPKYDYKSVSELDSRQNPQKTSNYYL